MLGDRIESALSSVGITSERIERWLGMPCNCGGRKQKLNRLDAWATRIVSGCTEKAVYYLETLLSECSEESSPMKWAYGITTVPERMFNGLFKRTLKSLADAGFNEPWIFVDGHNPYLYGDDPFKGLGIGLSFRNPPVRPFGNWWLGIVELWVRDPEADRFAIFQDDVIFSKNLKGFLDRCQFPTKGYWNLYTVTKNGIKAPNGAQGWYVAPYRGKGALALVFDKEGLQQLLMQRQWVERPLSPDTGFRNIDGGVVNCMNYVGYREFVHTTSLCQHIGKDDSSIKKIMPPSAPPHREWPVADSWRGEEFDCLTLEGRYLNGQ